MDFYILCLYLQIPGIASTDIDLEFQGYERFLDEHK